MLYFLCSFSSCFVLCAELSVSSVFALLCFSLSTIYCFHHVVWFYIVLNLDRPISTFLFSIFYLSPFFHTISLHLARDYYALCPGHFRFCNFTPLLLLPFLFCLLPLCGFFFQILLTLKFFRVSFVSAFFGSPRRFPD